MRGSQEEHGALYYKLSEKAKQKADNIRRSLPLRKGPLDYFQRPFHSDIDIGGLESRGSREKVVEDDRVGAVIGEARCGA